MEGTTALGVGWCTYKATTQCVPWVIPFSFELIICLVACPLQGSKGCQLHFILLNRKIKQGDSTKSIAVL